MMIERYPQFINVFTMAETAILEWRRGLTILIGISAISGGATASATQSIVEPTFEAEVRPIFRAYCFDCHGATDEKEGGLDLRLVKF